MKDEDGNIITGNVAILEKEVEFYSKLYTSTNKEIDEEVDVLQKLNLSSNDIPVVTNEDAISCEGNMTLEECTKAVKTMANGKSPGCDGYPIEFYKVFWNQVGNILTESYNHSFESGKLSISQRRGVITLIPKDGKDEMLLKNWRPISLLNADYKIAAKVLSNRMKNVLSTIISNDQTGFLPNRYIGESVRLILDIIEYTDINNIPATLFFIDFEKAYDKIEWSFINKCLEHFGFGEDLKKWVKVFYSDINSCVINNGYMSNYFQLTRGVRQGCPLSCYIFILCAELMGIAIRCNENIRGIRIDPDNEIKITQFADDTTLILDGSNASIRNAINVIEKFGVVSGLKLNNTKSSFFKIGSLQNNDENLLPDKDYYWTKGPVKFLGITISLDKNEFFTLNYESHLKKLKTILDIWSQRDLTPIGKITIIKSLALSQLTYLFSTLSNPPENYIKKLEHVLFKFIWKGKPDKINRNTLCGKKENGGLKMTNIRNFIDALKIAWVKRFFDDTNRGKWKVLFCKEISKVGGEWIWLCKPQTHNEFCYDKLCNTFLVEILKSWFKLRDKCCDTTNDELLWYNYNIKINKKTIFYRQWSIRGVNFISDLRENNQQFMTYNKFKATYNVSCNYMQYFGVIHAISSKFPHQTIDPNPTRQSPILNQLKIIQKATSFAYNLFCETDCVIPKAQQKWETEFEYTPTVVDMNWNSVYNMPYKCTLDTKTHYLQFRFIHRILPTNSFLHTIGLVNSDKCSFCKKEKETTNHLMWSCQVITKLWSDVFEWLGSLNVNVIITYKEVCFGIHGVKCSTFLNIVLLLVKRFIYKCKTQEAIPNVCDLKHWIMFCEKVEKNIAKNRNSYDYHFQKWGPLLLNQEN